MNISERIHFFQNLVSCNYPVYLWTYTADFTLLETNCPKELLTGNMASLINLTSSLQSHMENGNTMPLILSTDFGFLWIAAFEYEQGALQHIHFLGPSFTGKDSSRLILKKLNAYQLSVKLRSRVLQEINSVPIIPTVTLVQYAVMFHYSISGESISAGQVAFVSTAEHSEKKDMLSVSAEHQGAWIREQAFLKMIRDGNPEYLHALQTAVSVSAGINTDIGDNLRTGKNNALVLLTLSCRAGMEGGLEPSIAYSLNEHYASRIEACRSVAELSNISRQLLEDYVTRVRQSREPSAGTGPIQSACHYIEMHLQEELTLKALAERAGYTTYYFSHKFKEQTGMSVKEYILQKRIEAAKLYLSGTRMSIQEISDTLCFGNRSYFYSCFQKETGISPNQYRKENHML